MLILTNCLTEVADEGCLKVSNSLVKRIKQADPSVMVISYERCSELTDLSLELNKLLLNAPLFRLLRQKRESVLYIPFPAKPIATALRVFVLSLMCRAGLRVLLTMNVPMGRAERLLYRLSSAEFLVLSEEVRGTYESIAGAGRVIRLKTGVDTRKFCPVPETRRQELKKAYGFDSERPLVLHVGHLNAGRNVAQLMKISNTFQVLLVTSTLTKAEQDAALRKKLQETENIRILDDYLPRIQEVYQMADVYFFPVEEKGHCIDVPLSCLEAAACGKSVVTTRYGEMKAFEGKPGFFYLDSFDPESINSELEAALSQKDAEPRRAVLDYDWDNAVSLLIGDKKT